MTTNLHTLYFTIMDRRIRDFYRAKGRSRIDVVEELPEPQEQANHEAEQRDEHRHLQSLLNSLTARERNVIQCKFFDGLSTSQIAKKLGIPEGTVCSDLSIARRKLRDKLTPA